MTTTKLEHKFCEKVYWEMKARGVLMKDIAAHFGVSPSSLSRILKQKKIPTDRGSKDLQFSLLYQRLRSEGLDDEAIAAKLKISTKYLGRKLKEVEISKEGTAPEKLRTLPIDPEYVKKLFFEDRFDFRQVCLILRVTPIILKDFMRRELISVDKGARRA